MKVNGFVINTDQIAAGISAMKGYFTSSDVRRALLSAGVPYEINIGLRNRRVSDAWFAHEVANRLCQRERRAGRIKFCHGKKWRAIP